MVDITDLTTLLLHMEREVSVRDYLLTKTPLHLRGGAGNDNDESGYEADNEENYDHEPDSESEDDRRDEPDSVSGSTYARSYKGTSDPDYYDESDGDDYIDTDS
jgi:hypothetical protein